MENVRNWLLALISVSVLAAMADSLMPKGAIKRVGKLVCGLVMLCAILSPLVQLDLESSRAWLEEWMDGLEQEGSHLQEMVHAGQKTIIEQDCAAYILDKAAELGLNCTARVTCRAGEEALYFPWTAEVAGKFSDAEQSRLTRMIQQDLGIPPERQSYYGEGELP